MTSFASGLAAPANCSCAASQNDWSRSRFWYCFEPRDFSRRSFSLAVTLFPSQRSHLEMAVATVRSSRRRCASNSPARLREARLDVTLEVEAKGSWLGGLPRPTLRYCL